MNLSILTKTFYYLQRRNTCFLCILRREDSIHTSRLWKVKILGGTLLIWFTLLYYENAYQQ